jgi:PAS domain-containing protein
LILFGNRVLRRLFGRKEEEVVGGWSRLDNEELHNLYASSNILRAINWGRMRWVGHVTRMGDERFI